ncbi:MAG: sigma-70 family RNA polymerase sigma factor [Planctomycetota bacterium]|jgi:RNA polymerase sigma factor for flagellar operon FliA
MQTLENTQVETPHTAAATKPGKEMDIAERNQMIEQYLPLVKKIAGSVIRNHSHQLDYDDLVTAGVLGLMQAIENYDPGYEVSFAGYCQLRVRGAMYDELQRLDWVPRHVRRQQKEIEQARMRLEEKFNRPPQTSEIAEEIEMPVEALRSRQQKSSTAKMVSLSSFVGEENSDSDLCDNRCDLPELDIQSDESLNEFTKGLTRIEQLILKLYYKEDLNMQQIGMLRGISESRVCQIHSQILKQLKPKFKDQYTNGQTT